MYFNNTHESIGTIPQYFIDNFLECSGAIDPVLDQRVIIGEGNLIKGIGTMTNGALIKNILAITGYVYSQQFPLLKNMVAVEQLVCYPNPTLVSEGNQHSRYLARVGELILIPITGWLEVTSHEFPTTGAVMVPGSLYRLNNRIPREYTTSADFMCIGLSFLDFDLSNYLMLHDLNSPFIRRRDEYADPSQVPEYLSKLGTRKESSNAY